MEKTPVLLPANSGTIGRVADTDARRTSPDPARLSVADETRVMHKTSTTMFEAAVCPGGTGARWRTGEAGPGEGHLGVRQGVSSGQGYRSTRSPGSAIRLPVLGSRHAPSSGGSRPIQLGVVGRSRQWARGWDARTSIAWAMLRHRGVRTRDLYSVRTKA